MFRVGASAYTVRVMDHPIVHNGLHCDGLCDEGRRTIDLAPDMPPDRRLHTLLHELTHAYLFAGQRPGDDEALCEFVANIGEMCVRDLYLCGGEEGLKQLRPGERLGRMTGRIGLTRNRYCRCGGTIAPGDVECKLDAIQTDRFKLSFYCEFCGCTTSWQELATVSGLPKGIVIGEPQIEEGKVMQLPSHLGKR